MKGLKTRKKVLCASLDVYSQNMAQQYVLSDEDMQYEFSESFEERMRKLIRKEAVPLRRMVSTTARRVACIIIAVLTISVSLMSIDAVRNSFLKLIISPFENLLSIRVQTDSEPLNEISSVYKPTILEDYEKLVMVDDWACYFVRYTKGEEKITYFQSLTIGPSYLVAEEVLEIHDVKINGYDGKLIYFIEEEYQYRWTDGVYTYAVGGNVSKERLLEIIDSIQ
ncbi:MAG TPA: DUF4367 domain-containing protein [Oscillospiraceae bacterium]|nr:DUF4367 domain-containing protein [Oscillospiraceae bacterium]